MKDIAQLEAEMELALARAEARGGRRDQSDEPLPAPIRWSLYAVSFVVLLSVSAAVVQTIFQGLVTGWDALPLALSTPSAAGACGLSALAMGGAFYWLREKRRFIYATLELGAAAGTTYYACSKLSTTHDRTAWTIALIGSVYIAVRGYDNLFKWYRERTRLPTST